MKNLISNLLSGLTLSDFNRYENEYLLINGGAKIEDEMSFFYWVGIQEIRKKFAK